LLVHADDARGAQREHGPMTTVLVAHASKRGSTAEIAEAIAGSLREAGLDVDCRPVGEVDGLDSYDAVVLGSAVYMKRWQGDAKHFLRHHADELSQRPFWVFSSGPVGEPSKTPARSWLEPRPRRLRRQGAGATTRPDRACDGQEHARAVQRSAGLGRDPLVVDTDRIRAGGACRDVIAAGRTRARQSRRARSIIAISSSRR
jgi:menaquinone-dependent protoporphyrinogen oxidase